VNIMWKVLHSRRTVLLQLELSWLKLTLHEILYHEDWTNMTNVPSYFEGYIRPYGMDSYIAYFRLHHQSCSEGDTILYPLYQN